jgi:hypothetical protein
VAIIYKVTEKKIAFEQWSTATKTNMSMSEKERIRREVNGVYYLCSETNIFVALRPNAVHGLLIHEIF